MKVKFNSNPFVALTYLTLREQFVKLIAGTHGDNATQRCWPQRGLKVAGLYLERVNFTRLQPAGGFVIGLMG